MPELLLWDGPPPGSEGWTHVEAPVKAVHDVQGAVRNVTVPTITPHLPTAPSPTAVVVLPGGAFHALAMDHEGHAVADRLAGVGVAAYVLKYRVHPTPADDEQFFQEMAAAFADGAGGIERVVAETLPLALADAARAVELVRTRGHDHVAVVGFSAGGRLVAELATAREATGARPDAAAAIYCAPFPDTPAPDDAPPLFLLTAADDALVGLDATMGLHRSWLAAARPVELHIFERGGHGFGMSPQGLPVDGWLDLLISWLGTHLPPGT